MRVPKTYGKPLKKAALPPGTLVHVGEKPAQAPEVRIALFNERELRELSAGDIDEVTEAAKDGHVTWIDVHGVHDTEVIRRVGAVHGLHSLVLEDIVHTRQRPKIEDHESYLFIVLNLLLLEGEDRITSEQVSLVVGKDIVISFQERESGVFEPVRERLRSGAGRLRKRRQDYLAYALIDAVVDNYFLVLEKIGQEIDALEDRVTVHPSPETLRSIQEIKGSTAFLAKSLWPLREVIAGMEREEFELIGAGIRPFLRDLHDHTIQVVETVESYREMAASLLEIYLSSASNRMNEIMKVLTIIATIFIPLTFIAGIYGMNFAYMPELQWRGGYFAVLIAMAGIFIGMVVYFKRKMWL